MSRPYFVLWDFKCDIGLHTFKNLLRLVSLCVATLSYIGQQTMADEGVIGTGFGEEDRLEIQTIIGAQLDAFQTEDSERAFSYASPSIRAKFRTPARFFSMVRNHYPVVYDGRNPEFLQLTEIAGVLIQPVIISDRLGESWLAQYPMERQPNGEWLINGCLVSPLEDRNL